GVLVTVLTPFRGGGGCGAGVHPNQTATPPRPPHRPPDQSRTDHAPHYRDYPERKSPGGRRRLNPSRSTHGTFYAYLGCTPNSPADSRRLPGRTTAAGISATLASRPGRVRRPPPGGSPVVSGMGSWRRVWRVGPKRAAVRPVACRSWTRRNATAGGPGGGRLGEGP